ncbi:MAG: type II toxin-antitoxin system PemK/MazF family toxin [Armatimonadetes bacterium]|nr:type II toxin-antitoxin system PemK/MazF family toxin [Armatimonadota bacterium]
MTIPAASRPLTRGDVVLVPFPFTDLSRAKRRPGVIIGTDPGQGDFTLAFISSQQATSLGLGELSVLPTHHEFVQTGLTTASKVRAGKLVTLSRTLITRWLGRFGPQLLADLDRAVISSLGVNTLPYREEGRQEERRRLSDLHRQGGPAAVLADLGLTGSSHQGSNAEARGA